MKSKELLSIFGKIKHNVPNRIPYVCNRDLDLFLKRLRSYYPDEKICYYAVSEYGPTSFRPHWHLLLFSNSERFSKLFLKMYLRLGLTDVVMRHCREDSQHRMLRRMLTVLSLYPTFILKCQKWCDLNPSIPLDLQNQISFLERYELPKLTKLPLNVLMESALSAMAIFAQLNLRGRISFDYSPIFRIYS